MTGRSLVVDLVVTGLLLWIAWSDLRGFRIPNRAILVLVPLFPAACLAVGRGDLLPSHALFATAALVALIGAFAAGICGGGDAKLLAAAILWIGPEEMLAFAALLLAAVAAYALGAALRVLPARRDGGRLRIPLGPCIACAWIGQIVLTRVVL